MWKVFLIYSMLVCANCGPMSSDVLNVEPCRRLLLKDAISLQSFLSSLEIRSRYGLFYCDKEEKAPESLTTTLTQQLHWLIAVLKFVPNRIIESDLVH